MSLLQSLNALLPIGWRLTHLIHLDPEWQVNITDDDHVVVATGETPERALAMASANIIAERYAGRIFALGAMYREGSERITNLAERLGLIPKGRINRR
jgi:hypothetical protein